MAGSTSAKCTRPATAAAPVTEATWRLARASLPWARFAFAAVPLGTVTFTTFAPAGGETAKSDALIVP